MNYKKKSEENIRNRKGHENNYNFMLCNEPDQLLDGTYIHLQSYHVSSYNSLPPMLL